MRLSQWLGENFVLVDGPDQGKLWSVKGAPYLKEIADCLTDDRCNTVTVRKSEQSGASILALGWALYLAERDPCNILYAAPSIDALHDLNSAKLQPLIDAWQRKTGRIVVEPQTSRSGVGSSTYEKVFPGGRIWLANANAAMDLSSKTAKCGVKDELSKWSDIPGYGDPETLFFGRFTAFRRRQEWKILEISTPEVDSGDSEGEAPGHCRIDRQFKRSDQRFWHVRCPQCREFFVHEFRHLRVDAENPAKTAYICQNCGYPIGDFERPEMIRAGEWRKTALDGERHPGFHIDQFISLMMSYEAIGRDWIKASKKGEVAKKDFSTLKLGLPYLFKGDAPDHQRLMERREEGLKRGHIPPQGVILVASADVQMRGIWVEVIAFAPNRENWVVEATYLDGSTESPDGHAFDLLEKTILDRDWPDAFGRTRRLDSLGVDSGYRSHVVYAWTRSKQRLREMDGRHVVLALDGRPGWEKPAIGLAQDVDINLDGKKVKKGAKLWPIGTWSLKGAFYADVGKTWDRFAKDGPPPPNGFCHFPDWLDEAYFKQITSEYMGDETFRGRVKKVWRLTSSERDNHFLDCRVYNMAQAERLGLSKNTDDEWKALAKARGLPDDDALELFRPRGTSAAAEAAGEMGSPYPSPHSDSPASPPKETIAQKFERLAKANAERF